MREQLLQLPVHEFWIILGLLTTAAAAAFYFTFRALSRARVIEDIPTAKIRSAHQGYVELEGTALPMEGTPILAPLTGSHCCWYRYKIEKRGDKNWRTVESDTSDGLFLMTDDTGSCIIDPEGAEVTPNHRSTWYGSSRYPATGNTLPGQERSSKLFGITLTTVGGTSWSGRYRYTEERITPGAPFYAIGQFKTHAPLDLVAQRNLLIREKLSNWKRDRPTLLQRFDLDRNGEINQAEWQVARTTAAKEATSEQDSLSVQQALHQLALPESNRRPFLLSTLPQFSLARRYRWKAVGSLLLFFTCGGVATWMMGVYTH